MLNVDGKFNVIDIKPMNLLIVLRFHFTMKVIKCEVQTVWDVEEQEWMLHHENALHTIRSL